MIVNLGKHYLYRHINLSNNQIFYIGIGTKLKRNKGFNVYCCEYFRAFSKSNRSIEWHKNANNNYKVEILLESDDYEFIKQKEIEFIALYGRRNLGLGTLENKNAGGQGNLNFSNAKKVYEYNMQGIFIKEWDSVNKIADYLNIHPYNIYRAIKRNKSLKNKRYFYEFKGLTIEEIKKHSQKSRIKVVLQLDKNLTLINRFERGIYEAIEKTGYSKGGIHKVLTGKSRTIYGYYFKYEDQIPDKRSIQRDIKWVREIKKNI